MSLKNETDKNFPRASAPASATDIKLFFKAVEKEDAIAVNAYLALYPGLLECRENDTRSTPIIIAARAGNLEAVQLLHKKGADINAVDPADMDALMNACAKGEMPVAHYLVETAGMDAGRMNKMGMTPASCAYGQEFYALESRMKRYVVEQREARAAAFEAELGSMEQGTQRTLTVSKPITYRR
jgi:hypothetical protein